PQQRPRRGRGHHGGSDGARRRPAPASRDLLGTRCSMKKSFVRGTWQQRRAFSPAVITEGATRPILGAGHNGPGADTGKSLAGDFEAQCRQTFRNIERTLAEAGATLGDIVTMTVFLIDARHTTRMTEIRTEIFGADFPASAAITAAGFADPAIMIEIQAVAVVGSAGYARGVESLVAHERNVRNRTDWSR